jgi:hypothetical protein
MLDYVENQIIIINKKKIEVKDDQKMNIQKKKIKISGTRKLIDKQQIHSN